MRYLVLGKSRSGTTVTHLALAGHPDVSALDGELIPESFIRGILAFTGGHQTDPERQRGHQAIWDAITGIHNPNALAFGAKTACNNRDKAERLVATLREHFPDMRIIHTVRDDVVAHYGSGYMGKKTGVMHSWSKGFGQPVERVRFRRRDIIRFAQNVELIDGIFGQLARSHDYLRFENEDYIDNPDAAHNRLFRFLGLEEIPVDWLTSKKVLPPPREYIINYDQCHRWIRKGPKVLDRLPTLLKNKLLHQ